MNVKLKDMSRQIFINLVLSFHREEHALRRHPIQASNERFFRIYFLEKLFYK